MGGPAEGAGLLGLELGQELGQWSGTRLAPWQARGGGFNRFAHTAGPLYGNCGLFSGRVCEALNGFVMQCVCGLFERV